MQKLLILSLLCGLAGACQTTEARRPSRTARSAELHQSRGTVEKAPLPLTLYFETDTATLDEASLGALNAWADYLRAHPAATLTIAGHADERGPTEYNLGLGISRAYTAQRYLVTLGVKPSQIEIKSFGEERPAVAGVGEDAWAKNRRDELVISFSNS